MWLGLPCSSWVWISLCPHCGQALEKHPDSFTGTLFGAKGEVSCRCVSGGSLCRLAPRAGFFFCGAEGTVNGAQTRGMMLKAAGPCERRKGEVSCRCVSGGSLCRLAPRFFFYLWGRGHRPKVTKSAHTSCEFRLERGKSPVLRRHRCGIWGDTGRMFVRCGNELGVRSAFLMTVGRLVGVQYILEQPVSSVAHEFPPLRGA